MSDTTTLPGSHSGGPVVVTVPSADFATAVLNAISHDDAGDAGNINYDLVNYEKGSAGKTNILVGTDPGLHVAGIGVVGIVDEDTGADTLTASAATQFMIGNQAGDLFNTNTANVSVSGGAGNDTVNIGGASTVTTELGAGANLVNDAGGSRLTLEPSDTDGSDTVNATNQDGDYISVGGSGYDTTIDISGATTLGDTIAGAGGQTINLSGGTVEISQESDDKPDTVNVTSGTVELKPGAQAIVTGSFSVLNANDTISHLSGLSVTTAGSATVTASGSSLVYQGTSAGDTVVAGSGAATLYGGSGNEFFAAGSGKALFVTGNGSDTFVGGTGSDTMSVVGTGSGLFEFSTTAAGGTHVINAFSEARDTIDLSGYAAGSDTVSSTGSGSSEVTTISLADGTKITVHGIFHNSDIKFS